MRPTTVLAEISTNLRRGRPETATVHICILRNAACATAQAPRSSQMVQNQRIMVQTRPPRPWAVVNKTQPKARLSRDTFGPVQFTTNQRSTGMPSFAQQVVAAVAELEPRPRPSSAATALKPMLDDSPFTPAHQLLMQVRETTRKHDRMKCMPNGNDSSHHAVANILPCTDFSRPASFSSR